MVRRYYGYSQIEQMFNEQPVEKKVVTLITAFEIKELHPEKTKEVCIATAMGFKLSISGSGFFERVEKKTE